MSQVTVLCPGARRCNVKVTPNTVLLQVLEQACSRQQLDPAFFILKHHAKRLDLSIPLRYSGIPNNARLELVKVDTPRRESVEVVVAVQCADGTRVQATFNSNTSLWEVLSQQKLDSSPDGMEPSLVCLREEVVGIRALKLKTLRDIGLSSGKGILRLGYRPLKMEEDTVKKGEGEKEGGEGKGGGGKEGGEEEEGGGRKERGGEEEETGTTASNKGKSGTDKEREDDHKGSETKLEEEEQEEKGQGVSEDLGKKMENEKTEKEDAEDMKEEEEEEEMKEPRLKKLTPMKEMGVEEKRLSPMEEWIGMEEQVLFPAHPISYFPPEAGEEEQAVARGGPPPSSSSASQPPTMGLGAQPEDPTTLLIQHTLQQQILHFPPEVVAAQLEELKFSQLTQLPGFLRPHPQAPPPLKQPKVYDEPCEREVAVFHLDDPMPLTPTKEVPDSFFDHTVTDMHVMHSDLKKQARVSDAPLMTRAMREVRNEMKLEKYKKSIVRVYFSDRWVLQASFRPRESLKALVKLIRDNLADPEHKFHLYTTPPKHILQNGRVTFAEAGFIPAAIVHVGMGDGCSPPRLSTACLQAARCSPLQAEVVQARERRPHSEGEPLSSADSCDIPKHKHKRSQQKYAAVESEGGGGGSRGAAAGSSPGAQGGRKIPKWFKLGH